MKKKYIILISVVAFLIVLRLILPYVVLQIANKRLAHMEGYYGHIEDIDLSLYRGAYVVNNIYLNKLDSVTKKQTDFFKAGKIDISIEWKALLHGSIAGQLTFGSPVLIFTKNKTELDDVKKDTTDFRSLLKSFMPLKINRFEVNNGYLHYVDETSQPKVDVFLKQTHILAHNLTNATDENEELPSDVTADASVYEGTLNFNMKLNALANNLTFDLNAELKNTNLALLNSFLKAYGNFDVSRGLFSLYMEVAAKDGKFTGYVKPLIKELKVLGPKDKKKSFFQKAWEAIVGTAAAVLKNQKKDQLATKVPMQGTFKGPQVSIFDAVWEVLLNAFVQALVPSIDNEININSIDMGSGKGKKNFLERTFSSGKKDKDKKQQKKEKKN